jgi:pyruvate dehydrogenase E2 component (dihydrolipoamide acetyltransferase)
MSIYEFKLPDVGEGLSEGEIVKWHVGPGDQVSADQIIVDVQTDKAIVEIPAPVSGVVVSLGGAPNDVLPIGAVLAVFETDEAASNNASAEAHASGAKRVESATVASSTVAANPVSPGAGAGGKLRALASPATRKLARELGVDLTTINGSGSRGQVTRADIEQASAQPASPNSITAVSLGSATEAVASAPRPLPAPQVSGEDVVEPLKGLRRQVARSMEHAWRTVPHIFSMDDLDATELVRARASLNEELAADGIKLSYMPFFVKACVAALQANPRFNASLDMDNESIIYRHRYNIGMATATPDGLIVTVIHDADRKSLAEIAQEIGSLAGLARERKVSLAQLSNGTFTISNYGSYGGLMGTPIIRPPEVAIAGFGRLHDAVVPVNGEPAVRKRLPFCVSTDHRLNDGEHLGAFIDVMARYLADPVRMLGRASVRAAF